MILGFPKSRGTLLGLPIIRITIFWGLYWGPLIFGKLPFRRVGVSSLRFRAKGLELRLRDCGLVEGVAIVSLPFFFWV